jgi:hypothetical protein
VLDDHRVGDRCLKVSYGTTKYCSYFTRNEDCTNIKECTYLHELDTANQTTMSDDSSRQAFSEQFKHALEVVRAHIDQVYRKSKEEQPEQSEFPHIEEAFDVLIRRGYLKSQ